jgi:hypothetical protein
LFQREGHPIQVFGTVNNFLQKFFARCDFDEHRFGRPPHLRGGVDSGFRFWVNKFV